MRTLTSPRRKALSLLNPLGLPIFSPRRTPSPEVGEITASLRRTSVRVISEPYSSTAARTRESREEYRSQTAATASTTTTPPPIKSPRFTLNVLDTGTPLRRSPSF